MPVTLNTIQKAQAQNTTTGSPIGLLLCLTYATGSTGGLTITLVNKS
jgi:hypothetical protein